MGPAGEQAVGEEGAPLPSIPSCSEGAPHPRSGFASTVLSCSGCEGNTKDLSKGWGSCFVTTPPWPCSVSRRQVTAARRGCGRERSRSFKFLRPRINTAFSRPQTLLIRIYSCEFTTVMLRPFTVPPLSCNPHILYKNALLVPHRNLCTSYP